MELKKVQKNKSTETVTTSVKINKEDKLFMKENNIVLKKLVEQAIRELKEKLKQA